MAVWIDKKYLNMLSPQLQLFAWKDDNVANHRCPICGDSKKNRLKARGYHYVRKGGLFYKCHNCQVGMSTGNFIKRIDPELYKQYAFERFKNGDNGHSNYQKPEIGKSQPPVFKKKKKRLIDSLLDRVDTLPENHEAVQYARSRLIPSEKWDQLYYVDDFHKMECISEKTKNKFPYHEPRLILPFFNRDGQIQGFAGRAFDISEGQKRYLTGRVNDHGPQIFGYDTVDLEKPIIVVEGPIDSLFLPNCVAIGGTNFQMIDRFLPKNRCTLVFDFQPRNKDLVKIIQKAIKLGFSVSLLPENFPGKDINEAVENGLTPDEIHRIILKNQCSGLRAQLLFNSWKQTG